jgi:hypothetical protein
MVFFRGLSFLLVAGCTEDSAPGSDAGTSSERDGGFEARDAGAADASSAPDPDGGAPARGDLGPRPREQPLCADSSRCFYASPTGTGDCSEASPCTIAAAFERLGGGDTLFLTDGVYSERFGESGFDAVISIHKYFDFDPPATAEAPVVVTAAPGASPILDGGGDQWCVLVDGESHVVLDGLSIRNCLCAGVRVGYDAPTSDVTVRHSDFSAIRCDDNMGGVYVHGAARVIVEDNRFHDFDYHRGERTHRGLGLVVFQAIDLTIDHNEFTNLDEGLYYKHGEAETGRGGFTRIEHNVFHEIDTLGMETNQNRSEIRANLFDRADLSVHNEDGTRADFTFGVVIESNTFIEGGIRLQNGSDFPGARDIAIRRNVLYDSGLSIWTYGSDEEHAGGIGLTEERNCVHRSEGAYEFDYFSSDNPAYGGEHTGGMYTLAEWQALGFGAGTVEADPGLIDVEGRDYRPSPTSPCAEMGAYAP